jgi:hypothetical protein
MIPATLGEKCKMLDEYIKSLCIEYLDLCSAMKAPGLAPDEWRELSSQRAWTHDELIRLLGDDYQRPYDMISHCRCSYRASPRRAGGGLDDV